MIDERVVPNKTDVFNTAKHIARYNIGLLESKNQRVLDLSCGTGYGSFILAQVADSVIGVDVSDEAIKYAKANYKKKNLRFIKKDILDLTLDDFDGVRSDVIISFETVEHIEDLEKLERVFENLLTKDGLLLISVPVNENYNNPYHKHKFTPQKAHELFTNHFVAERSMFQLGLMFFTEYTNQYGYMIIYLRKKAQ